MLTKEYRAFKGTNKEFKQWLAMARNTMKGRC